MSRPRGGFIGANEAVAASGFNSAARGIWAINEAESLRRAGTWPMCFVDPTSISGLQIWLDAADSSTLFDATSGGSIVAVDGGVARWQDKSGNARHFTQSAIASRPLRKANQQNGLNALLFDGSNDYLIGGDYLDLDGTNQATIFLVIRNPTSSVPTAELINKRDGTGGDNGWFVYINATGRFETGLRDSQGYFVLASINALAPMNGGAVLTFKIIAGSPEQSAAQFRNGLPLAASITNNATTVATNTSKAVYLGILEFTAGSFYRPYSGNFCEVIAYNSALSDANRSAVESYLMAKWGIA
jgi:hypothetical protein